MSNKPFLTLNQQVKHLRNDKKIDVDNAYYGKRSNPSSQVKTILFENNYYCVVNGYKDLFVAKKLPSGLHIYNSGTSFFEIYALFEFDNELRHILLKYILISERLLKTLIAYTFSRKHKEDYAYLVAHNFDLKNDINNAIPNLINKLTNALKENSKSPMIKHFLANGNVVPLWVLINKLSYGVVSYFFPCMLNDERKEIIDYLNNKLNKSLLSSSITISSDQLTAIIKSINVIRNSCAHNERLFDLNIKAHANAALPTTDIYTYIGLSATMNTNIFTFLVNLRYFLAREDYINMIGDIQQLLNNITPKLKTIKINKIYNRMGFPTGWEMMFKRLQ